MVLAPEPGCAGRDSACEVLSGKQGARNGPPGTFLPWTQRPESAYSLGRLGTALRTWVVGSEVFTARVLISNNRQIPHALLPGGIFSNRSSKPALHRPRSLPRTRSPPCLLNPLSRDRDWRTCSKRALHLLFPRLLLTVAFPCKVPRSRTNENVRGEVLVLSLLLLKLSCWKNNQKISNNQEIC